jgi:type VI protein secretion system component VasA
MSNPPCPAIHDADYVERLIPAIQHAVASVSPRSSANDMAEASAPDLANALLMLLASVLEPSPACATPSGMRKMAEAASKELHSLMRDTRLLRNASEQGVGTLN